MKNAAFKVCLFLIMSCCKDHTKENTYQQHTCLTTELKRNTSLPTRKPVNTNKYNSEEEKKNGPKRKLQKQSKARQINQIEAESTPLRREGKRYSLKTCIWLAYGGRGRQSQREPPPASASPTLTAYRAPAPPRGLRERQHRPVD